MYSRNLNTETVSSGIKLNPDSRIEKYKENIPVKSFTDNFAYDRFNRMGASNERYYYNQEATVKKEPEIIDIDKDNKRELSENDNSANVALSATNQPESEKHEDIGILSKLRQFFDTDTIIVILAIAIFIFSDNARNDKLTPLALLAILFF